MREIKRDEVSVLMFCFISRCVVYTILINIVLMYPCSYIYTCMNIIRLCEQLQPSCYVQRSTILTTYEANHIHTA